MARASLFIVGGESRESLIGQSPQLSHPSVSLHFRHAENTITSMIAVISFEFVELAMHLDTTQDTAFPTLPEAELAQKLCVKTFFFFFF